ncbi:uncharacterized protein TrAFT101_010254 [Trichoderma asperellum]|uniref:uncharacterized protein n=1 Tax=Trichoderma asperellum TaxID=101201 RepID=UPI00332DC0A4|nr:hypothetical protein TrAFT101_010254 [Trichoderma asperellum]
MSIRRAPPVADWRVGPPLAHLRERHLQGKSTSRFARIGGWAPAPITKYLYEEGGRSVAQHQRSPIWPCKGFRFWSAAVRCL